MSNMRWERLDYCERVWTNLLIALTWIEGGLILNGIYLPITWLYIHLFADCIFFMSLCLMHVFDEIRFPITHTIFACVCFVTYAFVVVPTGLYYVLLLVLLYA
jgi:hypothetical protein